MQTWKTASWKSFVSKALTDGRHLPRVKILTLLILRDYLSECLFDWDNGFFYGCSMFISFTPKFNFFYFFPVNHSGGYHG